MIYRKKNGHKPNVCLRKKPKQLAYTEIHRHFALVINRNELMIKLREMKKTDDGEYIGITDLEGVIADVKGADTITVSHIAYKPSSIR